MPKFATNSWQARRALAWREPYTTGGAMYATDEPVGVYSAGRLPEPWRTQYLDALRDNRLVYVAYSYATPIAWVLDDKASGEVVIPDVKYSVTTTSHQRLLYALTASRETRASIDEAADRERQHRRNQRNDRTCGPVDALSFGVSGSPYLPEGSGRSVEVVRLVRPIAPIDTLEAPLPQVETRWIARLPDGTGTDGDAMSHWLAHRLEMNGYTISNPDVLDHDFAPVRLEYSEAYSLDKGWVVSPDKQGAISAPPSGVN